MLVAGGLCLLLFAGLFGAVHPAFDSLAHFRLHLALLAGLTALPLLATGLRIPAASALLFALAALTTTGVSALPGLGPVQAAFDARPDDRAVYRLLQMNLQFDNPTPEKVLSLIGRTQPDVVTLDEVSEMWEDKLSLLIDAYPYRVICPFPNGVFGVAILSRRPFAAGAEPRCFDRGALAIATVDLGGRTIDVAAIHLGWPWPFEQWWQIRKLSEPLSTLAETTIMAGDCNATPWSAAVQRVAAVSGLTLMPSVGPTWLYKKLPAALEFAGLPIDQVFSRGDVQIHSARRLESTGSDHLPVMVEFSLKPSDRPTTEPETATAAFTVPAPATASF